jgi:hypothetical protein
MPPAIAPVAAAVIIAGPTPSQIFSTALRTSIICFSFLIGRSAILFSSINVSPNFLHFYVILAFGKRSSFSLISS